MPNKASIKESHEDTPVGDQSPRDELMINVYDELRRLAAIYLRRERTDHTLQPTALVHEAYMRIAVQEGVNWRNREHFVGVAAQMMRRVLVDHACGRRPDKRGGGERLPFAEAEGFALVEADELVELDKALKRLSRGFCCKD